MKLANSVRLRRTMVSWSVAFHGHGSSSGAKSRAARASGQLILLKRELGHAKRAGRDRRNSISTSGGP